MTLSIGKGLASILGACVIAGAVLSPAAAQDQAREFSQATGDVVNSVMELADDEKIQAALDELRALINQPDLKAYERATIYQMIGQYAYELDRIDESQRAFENALLHSDGLLPNEVDNLKVVIAQLMIGNGQYSEGAARLENYLASGGEEKPQYIELLVNARAQAEDYAGALPWAEKWVETAAPKQRKHYDLMNFLYNNLGMPEDQIRLIKEMIDQWPEDRNLWDSWASILARSDREAEAFEVQKMMYQAGLIETENDLLRLIDYHAFYDMPFQAAEILEKEIGEGRVSATSDALQRVASLFRQARAPERALPYLERAAQNSRDPKLQIDVAAAFSAAGTCDRAETSLMRAIENGYDAGKAYMQIGNCYADKSMKLDDLSCDMTDAQRQSADKTLARTAALKAFDSVPEDARGKPDAQKWVSFIRAEIDADERRCDSGWKDYPVELCYQKIKRAYDAAIFTDGFNLEDTSCEKYVDDYNRVFRRGASSE